VTISGKDADRVAGHILAAFDGASSIPPITDERPDFDLDDAYAVAAVVTARRMARGDRPVGWKVGFTNTTIWDEYGVHAPIWGPMYATTVGAVDPVPGVATCAIGHLVEPRIEPEIVLKLAAAPHPEMDERELLGCLHAVAHGFEIVQSVFPGWRFRAPDTVAAFALHGLARHGPFVGIDSLPDPAAWLAMLSTFRITLFCDGTEMDRGVAGSVLGDGPLAALRHLARGLVAHSAGYSLNPGDLVTTGTITRAFPIRPGERWSTEVEGLPVPGLALSFV
jgi:2-oxo-3-hexenedioate decarboxylase